MGAAMLLAAIFETAFGVAKLGKLAALVSEPVLAGFLNAFALFLVKSQIKVFTQVLITHTLLPSIITLPPSLPPSLPAVCNN